MHDRDDAPSTGATGQASPALDWPEPHGWPADDASTLEWARFYFHDLRFHDLRPTPAQEDRDAHAKHLAGEAESEWRWAHKGAELPLAVAVQIRTDAQALADGVRGPIPALTKRPGPVTDADLVRWFTASTRSKGDAARTQHHLERGVCVHLGEHGARLAQIDVDPRRGGTLAGGLADTPGLRVQTPRGGVHVFLRAAPGQAVHHSDGALQKGVEVRTSGWALLPSGVATPGRTVVGRDPPGAVPAALLVPPPRASRAGGAAGADRPAMLGPDGAPMGRTAALVASPIGRGDGRTAAARTIVGMLARAEGLPGDVVEALAELLTEYGAGREWSAPRVREEVLRWREALTRGPRDATFAAEVLETWLAVRDVGPSYKGASWARATARSLWKTADRREEGRAGAEDLGHSGDVEDYAAPLADPPPEPSEVQTPAPHECVGAGVPITRPADNSTEVRASNYVIHGPESPQSAVEFPRSAAEDAKRAKAQAERDDFLRRILPFSADAYPDDVADRDMERVPLRVDALYPFRDFWTVTEERPDETEWAGVVTGHGVGRHLARTIGGLLPGSMVAVGGAGAKIGKTHFVGQMVEGLALDAAARILGVPGYQDKPIVMVTWVTEMPKPGEVKYRMLARLFGFDAAALASSAAPEAPGIIHMAEQASKRDGVHRPPTLVVEHARRVVRAFRSAEEVPAPPPSRGYEKNPVAFYLKHLQTEVRLSAFPAPTGQGRSFVDQASGTNLIGHVADGVMLRRRELAERIGVAEDKITPIVVIDPGQRFIGGGESSKRELDAFLLAVQTRLCFAANGVGAVVLLTCDTTKDAVSNIDLDTFLSEDSGRLASRVFAGSQAWMHIPDTILGVCSEEGVSPYQRTQNVRVLMTRNGAQGREAYPFGWETFCGRFRPRAPIPLRDPADLPERGGARGRGGRGNREWSPPDIADHDGPGARLPPRKQNGGRQHYGQRDD